MSTVVTTIDSFIGGSPAPAAGGRCEDILDPATGDVIATVPLSEAGDVDAAVAAASAAFEGCRSARRASARWRCCGSPKRSRSMPAS